MARSRAPLRARHLLTRVSCALRETLPTESCRLLALFAIAIAPSALATAQEADPDPPAHVSFVDGAAVLERDGRLDNAPANMPLLAGDRVRTQSGRVEILFGDGSTLHLDTNTTVDFQSDELVRLLDGRVRLTIAGPSRPVSYRIDAPGAWAQITQPGEYRLSVLRGVRQAAAPRAEGEIEVELAVLRGAAELVNDDGRTPIRAGERAFARAGVAPSYAYVFNSAAWDAFDRWSEARRDYRLGLSTQYLPDQVRSYARTFDSYGSWRHMPTYGYVWYPTVHVGWRPYYYGRWARLRPWGWTWIGADPWGWATHHYGRWGFSAGAWFWIPGRRWGPAWVSWAYAPGYVSWCPLGWDNRPILQIVNVYSRGYNPWSAWTVVPRRHFGVSTVHVSVVAGHLLDTRTRGAFVHRSTAPDIVGYAVPRSTAPIHVAGTRGSVGSVRAAGDSTVYTNLDRAASRVRTPGARVQVDAPAAASPRAVPRAAVGAPATERVAPRTDVGAPAQRERAMPRSSDSETPRMVPDRPAVRSRPRADAGRIDIDDTPGRRAVPRAAEPGATGAPPTPPSWRAETPGYRRAPSSPMRVPDSAIDRREPPSAPMGVPDRSIHRGAPPSPPPASAPPGMRAVPRSEGTPAPAPGRVSPYRGGGGESRAPDAGPAPGQMRAVPRGAPEAPSSARPAPDRGAPAARPRGGESAAAPEASRRRR